MTERPASNDAIGIRGLTRVSPSRVLYWLHYPERLKDHFLQSFMDIDFGIDVTEVPDGVLYMPAVGNVLMVAMVAGADVNVPCLDASFRGAAERVVANLRKFFPDRRWGGRVVCSSVEEQAVANEVDDGALLLFSGGLDSYAAFLGQRNSLRALVFVRGLDLPAGTPMLDALETENAAWADRNKCRFFTVRFDQRAFFNHAVLGDQYGYLGNDNFWGNIQYGITAACLPVPIAHAVGCVRILAGSCRKESEYDFKTCGLRGSLGCIVNEVKWSGGEASLTESDFNRQEKIECLIAPHWEEERQPMRLKVCWNSAADWNCGRCEKCSRTILGLLAAGLDPRRFGFPDFQESWLADIRARMLRGDFPSYDVVALIWREIQESARRASLDEGLGDGFWPWFRGFQIHVSPSSGTRSKRTLVERVRSRVFREIHGVAERGKDVLATVARPVHVAVMRRRRGRKGEARHLRQALLLTTSTIDGSKGDDALLTTTVAALREKGYVVDLGLMAGSAPFAGVPDVRQRVTLFQRFGFPGRREWLSVYGFLSGYDCLVSVGADNLDGRYSRKEAWTRLELHKVAVKLGLASGIVGCSFNAEFDAAHVPGFASLPPSVVITIRDEVSATRFKRAFSGQKIVQSSDPAFLLEADRRRSGENGVDSWIKDARKSGYRIIGLGPALAPFREAMQLDPGEAVERFAQTLSRFADRERVAFLFFPHDERRNNLWSLSDRDLGWAMSEKLKTKGHRATVVGEGISAARIKGLAETLDLALTCRMHFAIACLGSGIPTVCVPYQGKFEGLLDRFNIAECLLSPEEIADTDGQEAPRRLSALLRQSDELRARVTDRLPGVKELSKRNFAWL